MSKKPVRRPKQRPVRRPAGQEQPALEGGLSALKEASRTRMRMLWDSAQAGGSLPPEDARTVEVMRQHPEYIDLWERLDELTDAEIERDGTNPILHVTMHTTVENQIAEGNPPETARTVREMMKKGLSRHEAIHRVAYVMSGELYEILQYGRAFDRAAFVRGLKEQLKEIDEDGAG